MALSPQTVYNDLLQAGASTIEAIGIMANAINESNFDPEAVGDQGTSFGFVQEHGNYSNLVTGNQTADITSQIQLLRSQGGFGDASGSSGAQAAGSFAANFERCVGCQPGGDQYNQRVANAATVEGWISSGKWPTSAGSAIPQQAQTTSFLTDPVGSIASGLFGGLAKALGVPSFTEVIERLGLILFGAALVLVGIHVMTNGSRKQAFNINLTESRGAGGSSTKTRTIKTPVGTHRSSVATAGKGAERTGAKEAVEAAAVALRDQA